MKNSLPILHLAAVLSLAPLPAIAGPAAPAPPPPPEESAFSAEVSLGYDSFYIFRGEELFEQVTWAQVEINLALTNTLTFTLTPWHLTAVDDDYTELDLLPSLTWDAGFAEFTVGYAGYFYPRGSFGGKDGIDDEHEVNLTAGKSFGIFEITALAAYNFDRDGTYFEAKAAASFSLCKSAALEPSVALGYSSHYFAEDGFSHVLLSLALPINLGETVTLTPYVAGNLPLEVLDENQDAELFGGAALAISF